MEPHTLRALCTELSRMRIRPGTGNLCVGTYSEYLCVMEEKKRLGRRGGGGVSRGLFSSFNFYSMHNTPKPWRWVSEPCGGGYGVFFFSVKGRGGGRCFVFLCVFPSSVLSAWESGSGEMLKGSSRYRR